MKFIISSKNEDEEKPEDEEMKIQFTVIRNYRQSLIYKYQR